MIFLGLVLGGVALDKKFSTSPWLTLVGTAFGGTAAFYTLYKAIYGIGRKRAPGSPSERADGSDDDRASGRSQRT